LIIFINENEKIEKGHDSGSDDRRRLELEQKTF
jgi:hypothetical protein